MLKNGDWTYQVRKSKEKLEDQMSILFPRHLSQEGARYIAQQVLYPQVQYALFLMPHVDNAIAKLEILPRQFWMQREHLATSTSKELIYTPMVQGGMGWEEWKDRLYRQRTSFLLTLLNDELSPTSHLLRNYLAFLCMAQRIST